MPAVKPEPPTYLFEGARIIWRNFEGRPGPYNLAGERSFHIVLSPEDADKLSKDGWNVKIRDPKEEGDDPIVHIPVEVGFGYKPPTIVLMTSRTRTHLYEHTCGVLDFADIINVDVIIRGFAWDVNGKKGIKAYLQTIFVLVREDALEAKYAIYDVGEVQPSESTPQGA